MSTPPQITEKAILNRVGDRSFKLGRTYAGDGSVFNIRRQGLTLKAQVQGTADQPYRVEATFYEKGHIEDADCSCPVGSGGSCKHVAAVLLTWRERPEEFVEVEALHAALEKRSKKELIALITEMLDREPDLESLLELPLAAAGTPAGNVTPEAYQRQAEAAFRRGGYEWGAAGRIARDLSLLTKSAGEFLKQGQHDSAAAAYQGILAGVLANFEGIQDEEGDLYAVVGDCIDGLAECLSAFKGDPARREPLLRAVFEAHLTDIEEGGIALLDSAEEDPLEDLTPEENERLLDWIREAIQGARDWSRKSLEEWLLNLEADELDEEAYLRRHRELGHRQLVAERLLELGRLDEALKEVEQAQGYELIHFADLLVSQGHADEAERLVRGLASRPGHDYWVHDWLKKRAVARKDWATVLELTEKPFRQYPTLEGYRELRKLAQKVGRWETLRPELLKLLKKGGQHTATLIRVYLDEGEIDQALEAVKAKPQSASGYGYYGVGADLQLEVAKAAEKTRPRAALEFYRAWAEAAIPRKHRSAYQEACGFLKKVRELHKALGEEDTWTKYVAQLRARHPTLKAFQEELTKAKL
ncbi:MAG: SWIM zinc finger family protein [Gemmataceae bacterium]|nr:SWIM zinc finger family protein [Gemmataceae bacterium]